MVALAAEVFRRPALPVAMHAFTRWARCLCRRKARRSRSRNSPLISKTIDLRTVGKAKLVTLCGRYYAMDRDKRWERVERAYDLLTQATGARADDPVAAIKTSYAAKVTDEFVLPVTLGDYAGMKDGDGILFANFRADQARAKSCRRCWSLISKRFSYARKPRSLPLRQGWSNIPISLTN